MQVTTIIIIIIVVFIASFYGTEVLLGGCIKVNYHFIISIFYFSKVTAMSIFFIILLSASWANLFVNKCNKNWNTNKWFKIIYCLYLVSDNNNNYYYCFTQSCLILLIQNLEPHHFIKLQSEVKTQVIELIFSWVIYGSFFHMEIQWWFVEKEGVVKDFMVICGRCCGVCWGIVEVSLVVLLWGCWN